MSDCHHIDYGSLRIYMDTREGRDNIKFRCRLCEAVLNEEEYHKLIRTIREKREDGTLTFWKTPNGGTHTAKQCPNMKKCDIHSEDEE